MSNRGFTIIELMVSISVIAVLLGITLPALRSARVSALELAVVNHQRQVGAELERYTVDHQNLFPHYAEAGADSAYLEYAPNDHRDPRFGHTAIEPETGAYWAQADFWWWVLETQGYDGALARRGPEVEPGWDEKYRPFNAHALDTLTYCAFAKDALFREEPGFDDVTLHSPRRTTEVEHPSAKGLLWRGNRVRADSAAKAPVFITFADGHAERVAWRRFRPAAVIHFLTGRDPLPVWTTVGGLGGRDL